MKLDKFKDSFESCLLFTHKEKLVRFLYTVIFGLVWFGFVLDKTKIGNIISFQTFFNFS
jgi:hypothetical protein